MTSYYEAAGATTTTYAPPKSERSGSIVVKWVTSTDHKVIGNLYLITSFVFFLHAPDGQ